MIRGFSATTLQTMLCLIVASLALNGCKEKNPLQLVSPEVDIQIEVYRFDQSLFSLTPMVFVESQEQWIHQYGELYQRYIEDVLQLGSLSDSNLFDQISLFTNDQSILEVQKKVQEVYPDLTDLNREFSEAWSYYHYYFPEKNIPQHASLIGGFNTPAVLTENGIGVGLEMFLGEKCEFYDYLQLPVYLRNRMTPEHIVPTVLKGWVESELASEGVGATFLDRIIEQGKVMYCLDALLPFTPDSLKMGYTSAEMQWAFDHEEFVWAHLIDNELLFSTNTTEIAKFTNDGPFTVDLVKESPSRMGYFIGWQIVRAYMEQQDQIDLSALINQNDAQLILNTSKYKP